MSVNLRYPNITGKTEKERLEQMSRYLYQLVGELQFALSTVESGTASPEMAMQVAKSISVESPGGGQTNINPTATFESIKSLIIKSADIVQAYYDEITTRLDGVYVAESDFGTYDQQTSQIIEQTSTNTTNLFSNLQIIETNIGDLDLSIGGLGTDIERLGSDIGGLGDDIDGVDKSMKDLSGAVDELKRIIVDTQAYIKTGLLDDTTVPPVYGVEVGQTDTINGESSYTRYARFTSDRLSFFDQNNIEVAYISNRKLFISNVEIKDSFQEGGYKDFIDANGGIITKWVGGDG